MRTAPRPALRHVPAIAAAALTAAVLVFPVAVAGAQAGETKATPSAEAWFLTLPAEVPDTCDLPVGCAPAIPDAPVALPSSQYPAGTLHVGVRGGLEEARTYLTLDLADVPADMTLTGGTLVLPVATEPQAGTVAADMAELRACLVTEFVIDGAEGALEGAPETACTTASPASYVPAAEDRRASFTVDLAPFVEHWSARSGSLVLLPGEAPTGTWHVAFSRRDRDVAPELRIVAHLDVAPSESPPDPGLGGPGAGSFDERFVLPVDSSASFATPPLSALEVDAAPARRPVIAPATAPVAALIGGRYAYPGMLLLPLLVGFAVAWTGRAFTRDLALEPA